jgi:SAM-dependent methyltransferase
MLCVVASSAAAGGLWPDPSRFTLHPVLTSQKLMLPLYRLIPARLRFRLLYGLIRMEAKLDRAAGLENLLNLTGPIEKAIGESCMRQDGGVHPKHALTQYHRFFTSRIQPGDKVADIGCGIGFLAYDVAKECQAEVHAVDISARSICEAQRRFRLPSLHFLCADATQALPIGDCDVVILSNILEHIAERGEFIKILAGTFHPKRLLIRVPVFDRHWIVPLKKRLALNYFLDKTHFVEHTSREWLEEFQRFGLRPTFFQVCWGELWCECLSEH